MLIALCGKPSAGKSTFFKACTLADVSIANYPFTTLKTSEGIAFVKTDCIEKEFGVKCNPREGFCINGKRFIPVKLIDIPGLIEGSHKGHGKGNEFLSDVAAADVLIHVIDIAGSTNEKGEAVEPGLYNPFNDVKFMETELDYWFLGILRKGWDKFSKVLVAEKHNIVKALAKQLSGLKVTEYHVKEVLRDFPEDPTKWSEEQLLQLASLLRKKAKPLIIAANKIDISTAQENLRRLRDSYKDYAIIPCSGDSEVALREATKKKMIEYVPGEKTFKVNEDKLDAKQKKALEFIKKNVLEVYGTTGVQDALNEAVFNVLDYICVYPGGVDNLKDSEGRYLTDCFLMKNGSTVIDFAFRIHTDIGKNFIKAIDVKKGAPVGKNHILNSGDVIEIMTRK